MPIYNERDADGYRLFPEDFSLEKASRILDNYLSRHRRNRDTFRELVSWLILQGTGYSGGTSSRRLCQYLGVRDDDRATWTHWKERKPGE